MNAVPSARPRFELKTFSKTSGPSQYPSVTVDVDDGYKIVGGGAFVDWSGAGGLLTAAHPLSATQWYAAGKDHLVPEPGLKVTGYAIAIHDPEDFWDVEIPAATSESREHPEAQANVPQGYVLTGGGALVDWQDKGNMLFISKPSGASWYAKSKSHLEGSPARITAFAIGLKPSAGPLPRVQIFSNSGARAQHPLAEVTTPADWFMTGGGGEVKYENNARGQMLFGLRPVGTHQWQTNAKDHKEIDFGIATAYAVAIQ
jgi:hypothetical protein